MSTLSRSSRILAGVASLAMVAGYFLPVWGIYLIAPQYPEGLEMNIWLNKITGQVEIINGLNHYIGMRPINTAMFPEFGFLVYIVGFLILFGLLVAITGKKKLHLVLCILVVAFAIAALVDFYLWGYDYGHNLDPTAPIQVPGLSYQPPVIGHKKLLNFDAYSYPDSGGWVIVGAGAAFFLVWFLEWRKSKKMKTVQPIKNKSAVPLMLLLFLAACTVKPEPIAFGKDQCSFCKMTIMDRRFGGEIVTKKGKVFKFDDAHCLALFMAQRAVELPDIAKTLFVNYNGSDTFIEVKDVEFAVGSALKSPMGSNAAAFPNKAAASLNAEEIGGKETNWATLYNILIK
jgi:copper chaperone NosL